MINNQNKSKVFLVIIAILIIANIAMLGILLQKKAPDKPGSWQERKAFIANFLQKEIGFDQQQVSLYNTLSNRHHEKISSLFDNIRDRKTENFKQLVAGHFTDSSINQLADRFAASQKIVGENMFNHIRNIRQLCTPEQLPKFDSLFVKVFNRKSEKKKN